MDITWRRRKRQLLISTNEVVEFIGSPSAKGVTSLPLSSSSATTIKNIWQILFGIAITHQPIQFEHVDNQNLRVVISSPDCHVDFTEKISNPFFFLERDGKHHPCCQQQRFLLKFGFILIRSFRENMQNYRDDSAVFNGTT